VLVATSVFVAFLAPIPPEVRLKGEVEKRAAQLILIFVVGWLAWAWVIKRYAKKRAKIPPPLIRRRAYEI